MKKFGSDELLPKFIRLSSGKFMVLRLRPIILRIHSSKKKEAHESIYSELLLYYPWRSESELMEADEKACEALYLDNERTIEINKHAIHPNASMINTMLELLESNDNMRPTHLSEMVDVDANARQEDIDDQEELDEVNPLDTSELPSEEKEEHKGGKPDGCPYRPIIIPSRDIMFQCARNLSFAQRIVFDKVVTYCKSVIMAERSGDPTSMMDPPLLIVHGKFL